MTELPRPDPLEQPVAPESLGTRLTGIIVEMSKVEADKALEIFTKNFPTIVESAVDSGQLEPVMKIMAGLTNFDNSMLLPHNRDMLRALDALRPFRN